MLKIFLFGWIFLIYIINSNDIKTVEIYLFYFEPGHSFMSADSFHHQVELSLKKTSKVNDFMDFEKLFVILIKDM